MIIKNEFFSTIKDNIKNNIHSEKDLFNILMKECAYTKYAIIYTLLTKPIVFYNLRQSIEKQVKRKIDDREKIYGLIIKNVSEKEIVPFITFQIDPYYL